MSETAAEQPITDPTPVDGNPPEALLAQADLPDSMAEGGAAPATARVLRLKVPVIAELAARRAVIGVIRQLNIGSVIEFEKGLGEPLTLLVNNQPFATGRAVKVGE